MSTSKHTPQIVSVMNERKPTPGPWKIIPNSESRLSVFVIRDSPVFEPTIAEVHSGTPNCEADATLIASAPELLEACRAALDGLYSYRDIEGNCSAMIERDKLQAAIAKATRDPVPA